MLLDRNYFVATGNCNFTTVRNPVHKTARQHTKLVGPQSPGIKITLASDYRDTEVKVEFLLEMLMQRRATFQLNKTNLPLNVTRFMVYQREYIQMIKALKQAGHGGARL